MVKSLILLFPYLLSPQKRGRLHEVEEVFSLGHSDGTCSIQSGMISFTELGITVR